MAVTHKPVRPDILKPFGPRGSSNRDEGDAEIGGEEDEGIEHDETDYTKPADTANNDSTAANEGAITLWPTRALRTLRAV